MWQTRIYLFVSIFLQRIRQSAQVSYKVELGIFLIIPDIFLKFSLPFQNIEAAFERCLTKGVVQQQNDVMIALQYHWSKARKCHMQIYYNLHFIITKSTSQWLLLRKIIFREQLRIDIDSKSCNDYT